MLDSIFFHIPKAAGTSVKAALYRHYGHESCLKVWPTAFGGDCEIDAFARLETDVSHWKNLMGHLTVARFREHAALYQDFCGHGRFCLAIVRDPVARMVSDYHYIRERPYHDRFEEISHGIDSYLLSRADNEQAQWLDIASIDNDTLDINFGSADPITHNLLVYAMDELEAAFPALSRSLFGKSIPLERLNLGTAGEKEGPSAEVVATLERRNALDHLLLKAAKQGDRNRQILERLAGTAE